MGAIRNANKILGGKPEGKKPLGRSRHRWGIKITLNKCCVSRWNGLAWFGIGNSGGILKAQSFLD
jgi:hypothetical protein